MERNISSFKGECYLFSNLNKEEPNKEKTVLHDYSHNIDSHIVNL